MEFIYYLTLISVFSFIFFGIACLSTPKMKSEFVRYGLEKYRVLTGALQLTGATGMLLGIWFSNILVILAASGLSILMFMGFIVRLRIKDSIVLALPSFSFAVLNLYIALYFILEHFGI
ncbi:DoxX family protein [Zeaxanthinibacter sp. PT1]|uniref:DoxX family protein n=1 Tax=Zeaxanthinibacter TaxID=561554 RepID=UPI00234A0293|nr:DoxX family protein [Zeaxanthinibacter sp. PT1]MDC6351503.1 DoxX family protein [Zeaxanthinibacter sp. PT1]